MYALPHSACDLFSFFFFQAEDGIRDKLVTGVQTCALPIFRRCIRDRGCLQTSDYAEWGMRNAECKCRCRSPHDLSLQFRTPHSAFQLPRSRSASATLCSAIAYAAVRNVTPFCFARSRTPT